MHLAIEYLQSPITRQDMNNTFNSCNYLLRHADTKTMDQTPYHSTRQQLEKCYRGATMNLK